MATLTTTTKTVKLIDNDRYQYLDTDKIFFEKEGIKPYQLREATKEEFEALIKSVPLEENRYNHMYNFLESLHNEEVDLSQFEGIKFHSSDFEKDWHRSFYLYVGKDTAILGDTQWVQGSSWDEQPWDGAHETTKYWFEFPVRV